MFLEHDEKKESIHHCCSLLGYSKQSYYKHLKTQEKVALYDYIILNKVKLIREDLPVLGGRKLFYMVRKELSGNIPIGRDAFFNLLREYKLLVHRKRIVKPITTLSWHHYNKYPNLIRDLIPSSPNELWVTDITYVTSQEGIFYYLSLVTDAYSRKIIGWYISADLSMDGPLHALEEAFHDLPKGVYPIHHSDRGVQYCCNAYVKRLKDAGLQISMTEGGNPRENAIAERVNGILKDEWLNKLSLTFIEQARVVLAKVIDIYNNERPHDSLNMMTPQEAYSCNGPIKRTWKTYYKNRKEVDNMNIVF